MSDEKTLAQREEERILRSLQKKSGPQTMDELKKKKEQDLKRKAEQDKKLKEQEEAKKKEAQLQQQKLENLKQQRAAEEKAAKEREAEKERELRAQKEREAQERSKQQVKAPQPDEDDEDDKEAARMSKMFGTAPAKSAPEPHRTGVDALLHKDLGRQDHQAPAKPAETKPVEKDWRDQEVDVLPKNTVHDDDEDAEAKEAARMAKMFGLTPQRLTTESPKNQKSKNSNPNPISTVNEDDVAAAKEAERMARMMGGNAKSYDLKEDAKEKERKKLEQNIQGISDPKELSRAFLNDPEMMAHLKDVRGAIAVNTLKGVNIPGGHKFD